MSAEVEISLRSSTYSGHAPRVLPIPLEPFSTNKEMGRILIRRAGETIGAGRFAGDLIRGLSLTVGALQGLCLNC